MMRDRAICGAIRGAIHRNILFFIVDFCYICYIGCNRSIRSFLRRALFLFLRKLCRHDIIFYLIIIISNTNRRNRIRMRNADGTKSVIDHPNQFLDFNKQVIDELYRKDNRYICK